MSSLVLLRSTLSPSRYIHSEGMIPVPKESEPDPDSPFADDDENEWDEFDDWDDDDDYDY